MFEDVMIVIPARGGSTGIRDKNLRMLGGKTLVAHSISAALKSGVPRDRIVVSSDDKRILHIAIDHDVTAHRRPAHLAESDSSTDDALIDALNVCPDAKTIVTLQPTSPIRGKGLVRKCIESFEGYDSLLTVTKFYNFFWKHEPDESKQTYSLRSSYDPVNRPMRQHLGKEDYRYFDNGNVYISDVNMLLRRRCRIGERVCAFPISELEGMQIDTLHELKYFETIFAGMQYKPLEINYE